MAELMVVPGTDEPGFPELFQTRFEEEEEWESGEGGDSWGDDEWEEEEDEEWDEDDDDDDDWEEEEEDDWEEDEAEEEL
jgi:hypothetical protein